MFQKLKSFERVANELQYSFEIISPTDEKYADIKTKYNIYWEAKKERLKKVVKEFRTLEALAQEKENWKRNAIEFSISFAVTSAYTRDKYGPLIPHLLTTDSVSILINKLQY